MFKTLADVAALAKVTRAASGKWHRKAGEWAQKKNKTKKTQKTRHPSQPAKSTKKKKEEM